MVALGVSMNGGFLGKRLSTTALAFCESTIRLRSLLQLIEGYIKTPKFVSQNQDA